MEKGDASLSFLVTLVSADFLLGGWLPVGPTRSSPLDVVQLPLHRVCSLGVHFFSVLDSGFPFNFFRLFDGELVQLWMKPFQYFDVSGGAFSGDFHF